FELFSQAEHGLARATGGLGLGLTLVRAITELHGGTVEAHSDGPGTGSEFVVTLPLEAAAESATNLLAPGGRRRVLVIEDNPDAAESVALLPEMCGHQVEIAV